ncbi:septation protein A [Rhodobacterales bacterium 52_120_T64]|nr:septation protein A [Rhodobacterales bacterium 52_120_T64]
MEKKKIHPLLKLALEIGPIMIFFISYKFAVAPDGATDEERQLAQLLFATGIFIPTILISLAISWVLTRSLPKMAVMTAVVVVVMGGLTLWLKDDTFIKMKPTILYALFAAILGFGLMRGQSYLQYVMEDSMPLKPEGWTIFTTRFALFFVCLAIVNEIVWRGFGTDIWVNFKTFALPLATFVFIFSQMGVFSKYAIEEDES